MATRPSAISGPRPYHTAIPGYVYGGLIASLIDCHATGTAAAAMYRAEGRAMDTEPPLRFVTASLHVDYLRPTPIDAVLEMRGQVKELRGRKVIVAVTLSAHGEICARGEVVCVRMPEEFGRRDKRIANGRMRQRNTAQRNTRIRSTQHALKRSNPMTLLPQFSSGYAPVENGELYYEVAGDGHPLLLIHAGVADRRMWDDQFAVFAERITASSGTTPAGTA